MPAGSTFATTRSWGLRLPRGRRLELTGRPLVMGVLNITPDSFSDGGRFLDRKRACARALKMIEEGADLIDIGAESTRPGGGVYGKGADTVPASVELERLIPVLEWLRPLIDVPISIDTRKGEVASRVLAAEADLINDISLLSDCALGEAVAEAGCPLILMHSRGELAGMQQGIAFDDVVEDVKADLVEAVDRAAATGVDSDQIILDPGIGFGKRVRDNIQLMAHLDELLELGRPLLLGASRKSFIGDLTGASVESRLAGSLAAVASARQRGASIVRVHDVAETVQFLDVLDALDKERGAPV